MKPAPQFGLKELVAIGVGGMIGGGIFSVMGMAVDIAGNGAPLAFLLGGLLAFLAGYSYVKLALTFHSDGASFTYLERAFPDHPMIAAITGWTVVIGYIGTMALYAFTFGAYGAELFGMAGSATVRQTLSVGILLMFTLINLYGAQLSGATEDIIVYAKIVLLTVLGVACIGSVDVGRLTPVADHGAVSVFMAGALIFVAYEGFQLITNSVCETRDPDRNIPRGIYLSIAVVCIIYLFLSIVAVGALPIETLISAGEYALAIAAEPALGNAGRVLVCVAALMATSSAINATLFGASRMTLEMASDGEAPKAFSFRSRGGVPVTALLMLAGLSILLTWLGGLELIATFSSCTFLLVSWAVTIANWKLRKQTRAKPVLILLGLILIPATLATMVAYLWHNDPTTLFIIGAIYLAIIVLEMIFQQMSPPGQRRAKSRGTDGCDSD
jgi:amino acid transporter